MGWIVVIVLFALVTYGNVLHRRRDRPPALTDDTAVLTNFVVDENPLHRRFDREWEFVDTTRMGPMLRDRRRPDDEFGFEAMRTERGSNLDTWASVGMVRIPARLAHVAWRGEDLIEPWVPGEIETGDDEVDRRLRILGDEPRAAAELFRDPRVRAWALERREDSPATLFEVGGKWVVAIIDRTGPDRVPQAPELARTLADLLPLPRTR